MCRHRKNVNFEQLVKGWRSFDVDENGEIDPNSAHLEDLDVPGIYSKMCYDCGERTIYRYPYPKYAWEWIMKLAKANQT